MSMSPARRERSDALHRFTSTQLGLVTTDQARSAGMTSAALTRASRSGLLERVQPRVWRLAGTPRSWEQQLLAAVLSTSPGGVASHRSAMGLHGIEPATRDQRTPFEISLWSRHSARVTGATVHRVLLPPDHVTEVENIRVTTYARTLLDNAATLGLGQLARALDVGLASGRATLDEVRATIAVLPPGPGRRRIRLLELLAERGPGSDRAQSRSEIRVLSAIHAAGLPDPIPQCSVVVDGEQFFIDFGYPELRVGLEYHSHEHHAIPSAFDADFRRDRLLRIEGWTIIHFTRRTTAAEIVDTLVRLGIAPRGAA